MDPTVRIIVRETWPYEPSNGPDDSRWEASWTEERDGTKHTIRSWFERVPDESELACAEKEAVYRLEEWFAEVWPVRKLERERLAAEKVA